MFKIAIIPSFMIFFILVLNIISFNNVDNKIRCMESTLNDNGAVEHVCNLNGNMIIENYSQPS